MRDVPASSRAYEHFLRANQIASQPKEYKVARGLYEQCVAEDPNYAPAWTWLGRVHRVIAKIEEIDDAERHAEGYRRAEEAFARAGELNPELPLLHHFITPLELESNRALPSLLRLLERATHNAADPHLFAGLVLARRYSGLVKASEAAHERARRLDPQLRTSVIFTFSVMGRYEEGIRVAKHEGWDPGARAECFVRAGRMEAAVQACDEALQHLGTAGLGIWMRTLRAIASGDTENARSLWDEMRPSIMRIRDPEARYLWAGNLMLIGQDDQAAELLVHAIKTGYYCFPAMISEPLFDPLRTRPDVREHLQLAETRHLEAAAAFKQAGGESLLGVSL